MRTRRWAPWLLWLVPALWSSNYVIARLAQGVVAPHALALGRWSLALMLMLPFVAPALWRQRAGLRREAGQLVVLGALGMWICGAIVYLGAHTTTATNIALIYSV
ncbi:MAG TPA: EamA family transporter, partial [Rubrivivax sp.]|nr:EamA family transporter [Rubrivivax sp.]